MTSPHPPRAHRHERFDRKALRRPDEFVVWTTRAATWAQEHRTSLLGAGAAVLLVLFGVSIVGWQRAGAQREAAERFAQGHAAFAAQRYQDAATIFDEVAHSHPRTAFGRLAALYHGYALARADDPTAAAAAYQEFLARDAETEYLRQMALTALARAEEAAGNAAAARDAYGRAAALAGPYRIDALLGAARLAAAAGDTAAAEASYRAVLTENPDAETRALVEQKLPPETAPAAG